MPNEMNRGTPGQYMALGAAITLAAVVVIGGIIMLVVSNRTPSNDVTPTASPPDPNVRTAEAEESARSLVAATDPNATDAAAFLETPKSDGTEVAPQDPPPPPELTDEEKAALEAAEREAEKEKERRHLQETFQARKKQAMDIIDTYLALPMEQRPDYLDQAVRDLMAAVQADREAAGLPARPRRGNMMGGELLAMFRDQATPEEKQKVQTFFNDVVQMQAAKFQAEMAERLKTKAEADTNIPAPPAP